MSAHRPHPPAATRTAAPLALAGALLALAGALLALAALGPTARTAECSDDACATGALVPLGETPGPTEVLADVAAFAVDADGRPRVPGRFVVRPGPAGPAAQRIETEPRAQRIETEPRAQRIETEPGDDRPHALLSAGVEIEIEDAAARDWRLEQRLVTTLSVSAEGPHVELEGWKHGTSAWRELPRLGPRRFRSEATREPPFPAWTDAEVVAELRRRGLAEWADAFARGGHDPAHPDLHVSAAAGLARIEWRLSVRDLDGWRVVRTLHFALPMGC